MPQHSLRFTASQQRQSSPPGQSIGPVHSQDALKRSFCSRKGNLERFPLPLSKLEPLIHASHRKDMLMSSIGKRKLTLSAIVLPLLFAIRPDAVHSQSCCADFRLELLQTQQMSIEFQQRLRDSRAWRDRERRNVPVYNARLNGAVLAFHKHIIQDGHYLVTNCSLCRKHLSQIKSYSKKLDQAMK